VVVVLGVIVIGLLVWLLRRERGVGAAGGSAVDTTPELPALGGSARRIPADQLPRGRVVVSGLTKDYGGVKAVDDVSFAAEPGRVTGIAGPNGAGKTTALRMLLGLVEPTSGQATIGGARYPALARPALLVGAVLEASGAHEGRTGRDHLRVICRAAGLPLDRADEVLRLVGLGNAAGRLVRSYSLGMRQRLGIAAALLGDPQVLILDEPGNGLDPRGIRWVRELLRSLAATGRTVLVSSHLLAEMEQLADDLVIIAAGRVAAAGTVASVTGAHPSLEAAFLELTEGGGTIR
jgi:ABC-2 type transport system ATP-binding protein